MCNLAYFITQDEGWKQNPVKLLEFFPIAEQTAFFMFFPNHPYGSQRSSLSLYCFILLHKC